MINFGAHKMCPLLRDLKTLLFRSHEDVQRVRLIRNYSSASHTMYVNSLVAFKAFGYVGSNVLMWRGGHTECTQTRKWLSRAFWTVGSKVLAWRGREEARAVPVPSGSLRGSPRALVRLAPPRERHEKGTALPLETSVFKLRPLKN